MDSLTIDNLYYYYPNPNDVQYFYRINGVNYYAETLQRIDTPIHGEFQHRSFNIDLNGSEILMVITATINIMYQKLATGQFVDLTNRSSEDISDALFANVIVLEVPLPGGHEIDGVFQKLQLSLIDEDIIDRLLAIYTNHILDEDSYDDILELINAPPIPRLEPGDESDLRRVQQFETQLREIISRSREGGALRDQMSMYLDNMIDHITSILNPPEEETFNVYIYNANPRTRPSDIIGLLTEFGPMRTFEAVDNHYLAKFINQESANEALSLNGRTLDGNILRVIREPVNETIIEEQPADDLTKESHAMYMRQVYGLPIIIPQFLIVNGLRISFISFQEVVDMLNQNQIERYILDPVLQPWAGLPSSPNRIITMFNNNGITYLVKAKYDPVTNQIFSPV